MVVAPSPAPLHRLCAALAALVATLVFGMAGPAVPDVRPLLGWGGFGLMLCGCAGMLAWHLASLWAKPGGRSGLAGAALPAALLALAVPPTGAAALLAPCLIALIVGWRDSAMRGPVGIVLGGAAALLAACWASPGIGALAAIAVPALALLSARGASRPCANDNPSVECIADIWDIPAAPSYARFTQVKRMRDWGAA